MCVLQPRQLFARAANVLANKLPAECVLRTPEDGAGRFRLLPALLPAALLCPSPGSAVTCSSHPMWGPVLGRGVCAGIAWGHVGMRTCTGAQRLGRHPGVLHGHSGMCGDLFCGWEICSLVSYRATWGLGAAGPIQALGVAWEAVMGLEESLLSSVVTHTHTHNPP